MIQLTIILLIYSNIIRYVELKENTSMFTFKQYMLNKHGFIYSLNIIIIGLIFYLLSLLK